MLEIVVRGTPAPQGSKRFVGVHNGRGVMVESSKKVKPWRQDVKEAARTALEKAGYSGDRLPAFDCPINVEMVFTLPKPKSAPKTRRTWPDRKPDLSKLVRSTEDALTEVLAFQDDARIVDMVCGKRFPNEGTDALDSPGVVIRIHEVGTPNMDLRKTA